MLLSMGMRDRFGEGFVEYARADMPRLLRLGYMFSADREEARDLAQETLVRVGLYWKRIDSRGPHAYATTVMSRLAWQRRQKVRVTVGHREVVTPDHSDAVDERLGMRQAMALLGPRQRTVLALRYYCDFSESDVAAALGCTLGTVKSQASRGLKNLRHHLTAADHAQGLDQPTRKHEGR